MGFWRSDGHAIPGRTLRRPVLQGQRAAERAAELADDRAGCCRRDTYNLLAAGTVVVLRVPARRASIGGITQLPAGLLSIWKRYSGMSLMTAFTPTGYILRWMDETGATRELEPAHGTITLGRAATNDLVLNDQAVSRVHAQIEVSDTGVLIRDQNSSNGLYVNSETRLGSGLTTRRRDRHRSVHDSG